MSEAPPTLMGVLPMKPPKKRSTRTVCRFFAIAVPMLSKQKARQLSTYTGERPMVDRFDRGESWKHA
jgi:hypothetical protein